MSDINKGEGNPPWFYASQLSDEYHMRNVGGASEVSEELLPVRVTTARKERSRKENALRFEVASDKTASNAVLKHFKRISMCDTVECSSHRVGLPQDRACCRSHLLLRQIRKQRARKC